MNSTFRRSVNLLLFVFTFSSLSFSQLVISEFRVRGPNGGSDEFVEIYNPTSVQVSIGGWKLKGSNSSGVTSTRATVPAGRMLLPGQYYLFTNSSTSGGPYSGSVPGDQTYGTGITDDGGIALTLPNDEIVDQVGLSSGSAFKEGTPLASLGSSNLNRSYERKPGGASCNGTDTGNNASDFQLISPSNPQNLNSAFCTGSGLSATGSANPGTVTVGGSTLLTVTVSPASGPPSTGITVSADLTSIGGIISQSFFDDGTNGDVTPFDNVFSFNATVALSASPGSKTIPASAADLESRTASTIIQLTVEAPVVIVPIYSIQGSGSRSPYEGQSVTTQGVVTGIKSNGFFIQTPDASVDADITSSEGLFVFTSSTPPPTVGIGHEVQVTGTVVEFVPSADPFSPPLTEIGGSPTVRLISTGNPLPAAISLTAAQTNPAGSIEQLEQYEGMRVFVSSMTVVGPTQGNISEANATATSNGVFFGVLSGIDRPFREPGVEIPSPLPPGAPSGVPFFDGNPERIRVDSDGQLGAVALDVPAGVTVSNLVGPLDYGFRTYTILPDASSPPSVAGTLSATAVSDPDDGELTVGTYNMQRFFDTVNDPGVSDAVLTPTAFNNRLIKASLTIRNMMRMPDVIGVVEVENLTTLQAIAARVNVDAVASGSPDPQYAAYLEEGNDPGGIDVGFLVKASRVTVMGVTQHGKTATYVNPNTGNNDLLNDRPPLVLTAEIRRPITPAFPFTVIVNHLRSLGSIEDPVDGNRVRTKRRAQAEFLANLIQTRQTADPGEHIVTLGDYNAFEFSDGYVDVVGTVMGAPAPVSEVVLASADLVDPNLVSLASTLPRSQQYSYVFNGNAQTLDHVLSTQNIAARLVRLEHARCNADFPETLRNDPSTPLRTSDHDPVVAAFLLPLVNRAPSADAGEDRTIECRSPAGAAVQLDASGTVDPDGDLLTFTWSIAGSIVAGPTSEAVVNVTLPLGTHSIDLTVSDGRGGTGSDQVVMSVVDTTPPTINVSLNPNRLWPPNHQLVDITATVTVADSCDPSAGFVLLSVTSNEPDQTKGGDKPNDIQEVEPGTADVHFKLRAERLGLKEGRVYTVIYRASDSSGNIRTDSSFVIVPHDMGKSASVSAPLAKVPTEFSVDQNYPNPFNPTTLIRFALPNAVHVSLKIYNLIGQEVESLIDGEMTAGYHAAEWNAGRMPSGLYIYRLTAGDLVETRKLVLMK